MSRFIDGSVLQHKTETQSHCAPRHHQFVLSDNVYINTTMGFLFVNIDDDDDNNEESYVRIGCCVFDAIDSSLL